MSFELIPLQDFQQAFLGNIELSSVVLGGQIVSVSDEFFAKAFHLLLVEPPPSLKGQFGSQGALFSGWESRRHNQTYDWCIIELGIPGTIFGFDIDTTHFDGNEAPQVSVQALYTPSGEPDHGDHRWSEILPIVDLGPNSRHLFKIPQTSGVSHVKLNMYPDGGIARFRVYGLVEPVFPNDISQSFDLAHVFSGGSVPFTSDQHFGVGSNLILPGRGKDMRDGWETKRSRQKDHHDWVIIKLGVPGWLESAEIDTAHYKGNFPESCELHATSNTIVDKMKEATHWTPILSRTMLGPHSRHFFQLENVHDQAFTHVKLTIYPDGGIKRIRIIGRRTKESNAMTSALSLSDLKPDSFVLQPPSTHIQITFIPVLPLTAAAFEPFGQVIQAYADLDAAPRTIKITQANQGTAIKFNKLALLSSSYAPEVNATTGLSIYRCQPPQDVVGDGTWEITTLERHPFTNQAFIPMGCSAMGDDNGLKHPGTSYLVVVAKNGLDDKPDLTTLRAFVATSAQGIMYNQAVWHQPMTILDKQPMDFTCVETQIGNGDKADCEILSLDRTQGVYKLIIKAVDLGHRQGNDYP